MRLIKYAFIVLLASFVGFSFFFIVSKGQVSKEESKISSADYIITGIVYDESDKPLAGAKVYSLPADKPTTGRIFYSQTDGEGKFILKHVELGNNLIGVSKEEDGYADTMNGFSSTTPPLQVVLSEQQRQTQVEIRLKQKSPRLTGKVINAQTKKPVTDARLVMCRTDDPRNCFSTSISEDGNINVLTTILPFTIKVFSPENKDWEYKDADSNKSRSLTIDSNSNYELKVVLLPKD